MTTPPAERFRKHLQLGEVGPAGQAKLEVSSVLVVGAGGLGCAALPYLVAAGLRAVTICDGDRVEASNLPRQTLYGDGDVGLGKARTAVARLATLNPACVLTAVDEPLSRTNVDVLASAADVVLDATDNFAARYLLHDACFDHRRALVTSAVHHDEGQLAVFRFDRGRTGPCWRCLWPQPPLDPSADGGCRELGIMGPVPGVLGVMQADQALRILLGTSPQEPGQLVHVDLASLDIRRTTWTARPECPLCGTGAAGDHAGAAVHPGAGGSQVPSASPSAEEVDWADVAEPADFLWIDARTEGEQALDPSPAALAGLPILSWRRFGNVGPPSDRPCVVFCAHGIRSLALARHWRDGGCRRAHSLRGGLSAQRRTRT